MRFPLSLLLLLALPAAAPGETSCPAGMSLGSALFATDIRDREPVQPLSRVPEKRPAIYFFTRVLGAAGATLTHAWFRDGQLQARVRLPVGGNDWRTWSSKNLGRQRGRDWSVRVEGPNACLLGEYRLPAHGGSRDADRNRVQAIRQLLEQDDLAGARMQLKAALADNPAPEQRRILQAILSRDMELARAQREIQQQALYPARSRLDALLERPLDDAQRRRTLQLREQLEKQRRQLHVQTESWLRNLRRTLDATLAGGRDCRQLRQDMETLFGRLWGDSHPLMITSERAEKDRLRLEIMDRRSGDQHRVEFNCPDFPFRPRPG